MTRLHSRLKLLSFSKSELMTLKEMEQNKHLPFHLQRRKLGKTKNTLRVAGHPRIGHKAEQRQKKQHLQYVKNSGRQTKPPFWENCWRKSVGGGSRTLRKPKGPRVQHLRSGFHCSGRRYFSQMFLAPSPLPFLPLHSSSSQKRSRSFLETSTALCDSSAPCRYPISSTHFHS